MPCPSSATSRRVSPPPPAWTSMRVALASSAFSTSSLTALAGRSTTSPAAMRLTVSGGRRRIGMAVGPRNAHHRAIQASRTRAMKSPKLRAGAANAAALALNSTTATKTSAAPTQAPVYQAGLTKDQDEVLVEELVVVGRLP